MTYYYLLLNLRSQIIINMKLIEIQRNFVRPKAISDHLKCPICLNVFRDANRLYCGHTFCEGCLKDYMKTGTTCPECRTPIVIKNIGIDLLARQIINQLQVFCSAEDCPWKGIVQKLESHVFTQCLFQGTKANSNTNKIKANQKIVWHQMVDDEVLDKINEHTVKGSLEARILIRTDSATLSTRQNKQILTNTQPKQILGNNKKKNNKNKKIESVAQSRQSDFNFLQSLFD